MTGLRSKSRLRRRIQISLVKMTKLKRLKIRLKKRLRRRTRKTKKKRQLSRLQKRTKRFNKMLKTQPATIPKPQIKQRNQNQKCPRKNLSRSVKLWNSTKFKQSSTKSKLNKLTSSIPDITNPKSNKTKKYSTNLKLTKNTLKKNLKSETTLNPLFTGWKTAMKNLT